MGANWARRTTNAIRRLSARGRISRRDSQHLRLEEAKKKLLDVGARYLANGDIDVEGVRFHSSYPTFADVLVENLYLENYSFSLNGSWVVFDIGANAGASSLWLGRLAHVQRVYAFEPVPPTYDMLLQNLELNPSLRDKIQTFCFGLGAEKQTVRVPFHEDHVMSVSSAGTFDRCFNPQSIETIHIEAATSILGPLLANHTQDRVFLKIDCEGAEYDILPSLADAGLLKKVEVVIVEWHGGDYRCLQRLLEAESFFCFVEWHRRDHWKIGMIKAVRRESSQSGE